LSYKNQGQAFGFENFFFLEEEKKQIPKNLDF
jgi:hypothetical protein